MHLNKAKFWLVEQVCGHFWKRARLFCRSLKCRKILGYRLILTAEYTRKHKRRTTNRNIKTLSLILFFNSLIWLELKYIDYKLASFFPWDNNFLSLATLICCSVCLFSYEFPSRGSHFYIHVRLENKRHNWWRESSLLWHRRGWWWRCRWFWFRGWWWRCLALQHRWPRIGRKHGRYKMTPKLHSYRRLHCLHLRAGKDA